MGTTLNIKMIENSVILKIFGGIYFLLTFIIPLLYKNPHKKADFSEYKQNIEFFVFSIAYSFNNALINLIHHSNNLLNDRLIFSNLFIVSIYSFSTIVTVRRVYDQNKNYLTLKGVIKYDKYYLLSALAPLIILNLLDDSFSKMVSTNLVVSVVAITVLFCFTTFVRLMIKLCLFGNKIVCHCENGDFENFDDFGDFGDLEEKSLQSFSVKMVTKILTAFLHVVILGLRGTKVLGIELDEKIGQILYIEEQVFVILYILVIALFDGRIFERCRR